jgi:single-stranded-DNA-specific exonuclease
VVLIAGGEPGEDWVGSGRSVSSFDLHGALGACSHLLGRWGGHRAAAGLSIAPENVSTFAEAFAEHAATVLSLEDLRRVTPIDAVVRGRELTLELCEELERLAPFGLGNPNVTLLAVGAELSDLAAIGEGKHLRLAVTAAGARSGAIAFGRGSALDRYRQPGAYDVAFRLTANHWNGTVTPQLVVKEIFETPPRFEELRRLLLAEWQADPERRSPWAREVFAELGLDEDADGWRPLVESPAFLAALHEEPAAAAA